jgi:hypothetical protein
LTDLATSIEIGKLKLKARRLHRRIESELDSVDCGLSLLTFIRPHVGRIVTEFDETVARLKQIDPDFPKPPNADQT